jgi:ketosteroid isomerase-like protein
MSDPAPANALQALLDERAITRLMTDYTRFVDFGEAARIAELFTEDGVWDGPGVRMQGRAEVHEFFSRRETVSRRTSRHVITNVAIDLVGPDEATALSYLVNFRHDSRGDVVLPVPADHPKYVGEYRDRFVRTAAGWRFAERVFTNAFLRTRATGSGPQA